MSSEYYKLEIYTDNGKTITPSEETYSELFGIKELLADRYEKVKIKRIHMPSPKILEVYYNKGKQKLTDIITITRVSNEVIDISEIKEVIRNG